MTRIYKRGEYWHADYFCQGRRIRTSLKTTDPREARRKLKELLSAPAIGYATKENNSIRDINLSKLLEDYLAFVRAEKSERAVKEQGYILKKFLQLIPVRTVRQIETAHIKDYKLAISGKKPNTIRIYLTAVRVFLKYAQMMGFLGQNPAKNIQVPKIPRQAPKYLSVAQLEALLSALPRRSRDIIYFYAKTGMRLSEGLNLKWEDVRGSKILVHQTKHPGQAFRIIPMDDRIRKKLAKLPKKGELIFGITKQQLRDDFYLARKKAELEWATIHTLRHTFASHLVMAGVPIRTVQELLGHTQIQTTMIYAHLSMEHLEGAIRKLPY